MDELDTLSNLEVASNGLLAAHCDR